MASRPKAADFYAVDGDVDGHTEVVSEVDEKDGVGADSEMSGKKAVDSKSDAEDTKSEVSDFSSETEHETRPAQTLLPSGAISKGT